jgi:hypothetical protein
MSSIQVSDNNVLTRLARIAAVLMWAPGVGISVYGGKMLAPYEIFILLILPIIVITSLEPRRLLFGLIAIGVCTLSLVYSIDRSTSAVYYYYYAVVTIPGMLLFVQIFEDDEAARAFFVTFVRTGIWLSPLAVIQFLSPIPIPLVNNTNYALETGLHRAHLFAPEASILAALYLVAICLTTFNSIRRVEERIPRDTLSIVSLFAGLATTVSTAALTLLPPLLLYILRKCGVSWGRLIRYVVLGALLLTVFFFVEYQDRVASGDSTSSTLLRFASMVAGAQAIMSHWITGLGLGMNRNVALAIKLIYFEWTHILTEKPGIDSFQLSLMTEMGVLPGVFSVAVLVVCFKSLRRILNTSPGISELISIFGICLWFVSLLTSGYRGLAHCWLYFPAGYVVFLRNIKSTAIPTGPTETLAFGRS